jgi:nucleotide-binding universal stress UspA family protein
VSISRSRASWWALAWAIGEARRRRARLLLVHVFRPPLIASVTPIAPLVAIDPEHYGASDLYAGRVTDGYALIWTAITQATGQMPDDADWEEQVIPGRPAAVLASLARNGDLLVFGSRHRGWLRRFAPGSVARGCARRANCPVMIVPEPSPQALLASLPVDAAHGHRFRWIPHHGVRTAS